MLRALRHTLTVAALAVLTAACAAPLPPRVSLPPSAAVYKFGTSCEDAGTRHQLREQPDYDKTGIASWYGPTFDGQRTANGEIFRADDLTAANRTLPMGTNVRVTNLENGRSLVVQVNDRGPHPKDRIIDVSQRAAQILGFYRQGTARVRVTYSSHGDLTAGDPQPEPTPPIASSAHPPEPTGDADLGGLCAVPGVPLTPRTEVAPLPTSRPSPEPAEVDSRLMPTG